VEYVRFGGIVLAVNHPPEPQRGLALWRTRQEGSDLDYDVRSGLAFAVLTAPQVNARAWGAIAVAAPLALLAAAAAVTKTGLPQIAGAAAVGLLVAVIVLAAKTVEVRRFRPRAPRDPALTKAFALTIGPACGLLFLVMLGAPLSAESVAVGLFMSMGPLATAVVGQIWKQLFRPMGAKDAPVEVGRDWLAEWTEAERALAPPAAHVEAEVLPFPTPHRATPVEPGWDEEDEARPRRVAVG
jgi:hypothetical protein